MPQLLAVIPLILAGTSAGLGINSAVQGSGGGGGGQPTPAEISNQAVNQETQNRNTATKEASQFLPQLQANTSGGLSPDAYDQLSSTFSGNANLANSPQMQQLIAKFLGIDNGANFGGSGSFGTTATSNPASPGLIG